MHALENLAAFVAAHREDSLPQRTRDTAALLVTDLMGAVAAGLDSSLSQAALAACKNGYGAGSVSVWMTGHSASVIGAAMTNSATASALDIDDGHRGAAGHPGAGIIPAVLALGQSLQASDARIFDAIALGYDVALRVASSRPKVTIDTYCSGRWVGFGVAAAASWLLGLRANQIAHAMAIAGAESPALIPHSQQDSSVKEGIPAAVVAGLTAAFRAHAGGTGPLDLIDDTSLFDRQILLANLGEQWWLEQCYLKPYACCRWMHAAVDAILSMIDRNKPIVSLRIETFQQGLRLVNARAPHNLEAGQYSYYFSCAVAALHGAAALQPVAPSMLQDPTVLELAARIELAAHEDFAEAFPATTPCRVILDQGDGPREMTVQFPLGDVANPMSHQQVFEKFNRISAPSLDQRHLQTLVDALDELPRQGFSPLFSALAESCQRSSTALPKNKE